MCKPSTTLTTTSGVDGPLRTQIPPPHVHGTRRRTISTTSIEDLLPKKRRRTDTDAGNAPPPSTPSRPRRSFKRVKGGRYTPRKGDAHTALRDHSGPSRLGATPASPATEDDDSWAFHFNPTWTVPEFRPNVAEVKDVQLRLRPFKTCDAVASDRLPAPHRLYTCRLFLQCTTRPYESVEVPDTCRLEMTCDAAHCYTGPPVLPFIQCGSKSDWLENVGIASLVLVDGIHVDRFWRTLQEDDGSWGWYRDAYVPLSFEKVDCQEFKLVSRVWVDGVCLEGETTFGDSA